MYEPSFLTIPSGQTIFIQNEPAQAVYQLLHGEVSLWRDGIYGGRLSSGHILGLDGAYASKGVSPCTARAESECRLAAIAVDQVPEALLISAEMAEKVIFSLSRQIHQRWEQLSEQGAGQSPPTFVGQILNVQPGTVIIREGEKTDEFYRIISTDRGLEVSSQGTELSILDRPGEFFGEMAAVLGQPRTATVRSLGRSALEVYSARLLSSIVSDYPELSWRLIQGLSQRLHAANSSPGSALLRQV
ncbi:MAG: Crp/Fnr family transcriptional regulator [Thermodesulfobacteriota bacterium]